MVAGAYLVQTGELSWTPFIAGLPVGFLIGLVLFINQFPDAEADGAVGKTHWVVRMGLSNAAKWYAAIMSATFAVIIALWIVGVYPAMALLGLIPAAIAVRAVRIALKQHEEPRSLLPAQAMTVQIHLLVGLLISAGLVASGL